MNLCVTLFVKDINLMLLLNAGMLNITDQKSCMCSTGKRYVATTAVL